MAKNHLYGMSPAKIATTRFVFRMLAGLSDGKLPKATHRALRHEELEIPMSDGVKLHAYVVRPEAEGKYPAILVRSPYVINDFVYRAMLPLLAKRGYACVLNTVRGAFNSEGEWLPLENDRKDGFEVVDWVSKQSWCDGKIGGYGGSYLGYTQWSYADYDHPALKTLCIDVAGASAYNTFWRRGMFRQEIWTLWATQMMGDNRLMYGHPPALYEEAYRVQPQINLGEHFKKEPCHWYNNWISNDNPQDAYWKSGYWGQLEQAAKKVRIPVMLQGGWFDAFLRPQLDTFRALPEEVRKKSRFFIGPWGHGGSAVGDKPFKNSDKGGMFHIGEAMEWFDYQLKGKPYNKKLGVVEAFNVNTDQWVEYEGDLAPKSHCTYYLQTGGALTKEKNENKAPVTFAYDPTKPLQTICGNALGTGGKNTPIGPKEQRKIGERSDVISFVSEPLAEPMQLCGSMKAVLYVASDAPATAFTVCVSEVEENGRTYNIRDDITDIRWRDESTITDYTPGECVRLELDLLDVTWLVKKGSRLRVDISSSNFPMYHVHPNTTEPWGEAKEKRIAHQTVYVGGNSASCIQLAVK